MNREVFSKFIDSPARISAQDIPALETFAEQFPYCQLAHFFVAKPHYDLLTVQADGKVQRAAIFASSRYKLKKFLEIEGEHITGEMAAEVGPSNLAEAISPLPDILEKPVQHITLHELIPKSDKVEIPLIQEGKDSEKPIAPAQSIIIADTDLDAFHEKIKKLKQKEIIDNFIKTEPRISSLAQVSKEAPSKDMAEGSIKAPASLVSENLANIMLKQGKTDKAIEIYEKLVLKFPEKKSYFAEKIESLKNK